MVLISVSILLLDSTSNSGQ